MKKPVITEACVKTLLETKYIKVFDLQYAEGKHYYDATRRERKQLTATKSDEEFQSMLPDAVSCFVILRRTGDEPRLLLSYEYRYPVGRFLLSPPAGLLDPEDKEQENPLCVAAIREIREETGLTVRSTDKISVVSPLSFSTPGMTDESNGLVCAVISLQPGDELSQLGAVGTECFNGFALLTKAEAKQILKDGRDQAGNFFSVFTWAALMYFCSDMWED